MPARLFAFATTLVALGLVTADAPAQSAPSSITYDVMTSYVVQLPIFSNNAPALQLVGVEHGQAASSTKLFTISNAAVQTSCERATIQMINRPGRFTLEIGTQPSLVATIPSIVSCGLVQR